MSDLDFDPEPHERVFYQHARTGDRGYLVRRNGRDMIRLDRPNEEVIQAFNDVYWLVDREFRPLTEHQLAQIAFEADKKLCFALGLHEESRREWLNLTDRKRISFTKQGPPPDPPARSVLFQAIMDTLAPLAK